MILCRFREKLSSLSINRNSIINLNLYRFSHVIQFDPIFARFGDLGYSIVLRIYLFPDRLIIVDIPKFPGFNNLELRANPYPSRTHVLIHNNITHPNIADHGGALFFWLLFLGLLFIL